jgi:hypothetical protein
MKYAVPPVNLPAPLLMFLKDAAGIQEKNTLRNRRVRDWFFQSGVIRNLTKKLRKNSKKNS